MDKFLYTELNKNIPDEEQVDPALSPVSKEEMEAELRLMNEAVNDEGKDKNKSETDQEKKETEEKIQAVDKALLEEIRGRLRSIEENMPRKQEEPKEQKEPVPPETDIANDTEEKGEPIIMREVDVKYETCRNCKGKGRVLFSILRCPKCGGSGKAPALKQNWKSKVIGYR